MELTVIGIHCAAGCATLVCLHPFESSRFRSELFACFSRFVPVSPSSSFCLSPALFSSLSSSLISSRSRSRSLSLSLSLSLARSLSLSLSRARALSLTHSHKHTNTHTHTHTHKHTHTHTHTFCISPPPFPFRPPLFPQHTLWGQEQVKTILGSDEADQHACFYKALPFLYGSVRNMRHERIKDEK
jgi:hypothetical protein